MITDTDEFTSETGKQPQIEIAAAAAAYFARKRGNCCKNKYDYKERFFHFDDSLSKGKTLLIVQWNAIILFQEKGIEKVLKRQADEKSQKNGQYIYLNKKVGRL